MNICIISGSARQNNNTIRVAKALERLLKNAHEVSLIDFMQYDIPLITQGDIKADALTPFQQQLVNGIDKAQIMILISPEYNWSTTPEILNMLHRFGDREFKHIFDNTVFAMVGVSTGKGGKAPALHLTSIINKVISFMDLDSFVSARIFESHYTKEVLDEEGRFTGNDLYNKGMQDFLRYTLRMAARWFR